MRPHRLVAQDSGLSRRQQGFKSPWGRQMNLKAWKQFQAIFIYSEFFFQPYFQLQAYFSASPEPSEIVLTRKGFGYHK